MNGVGDFINFSTQVIQTVQTQQADVIIMKEHSKTSAFDLSIVLVTSQTYPGVVAGFQVPERTDIRNEQALQTYISHFRQAPGW